MLFFWFFQLIFLIFIIISRYFFGTFLQSNILILSFLMLVCTPVIVPLVATIRQDMTPMRPVWTRAGCIGLIVIILVSCLLFLGFHISFSTIIFWSLAMLSIFFRFESRIFFLVALLGLIVTVSALLVDMPAFAESASVAVYLSLVLGVLTEIAASLFDRIHSGSKRLILISPEFIRGYRQALTEYTWMITIVIEIIFIIALAGRGYIWNFDYQMLLYMSF